ncbi:hypothetical protein [Cognatiluteimonas weifangensis]|nr:hypothetical protein [Luteimonas weifangensis]
MTRPMVTLLLCLTCLSAAAPAMARTLQARIARVSTAVATLQDVQVRLDWPAQATQGELSLRAGRVEAPDLGYRFRDLRWHCPLHRDAAGGWRCDGVLRSGANGAPWRLAVDLGAASTDVTLASGDATLTLQRLAATPDDTTLELARVPLAWMQALLAQTWADGQLQTGSVDGRLRVHAPAEAALQVAGTLAVADAAFDSADASIAGQGLGGRFAVDWRQGARQSTLLLDGDLRGGELLAGDAYIALPATPVGLRIEGRQAGAAGWQLPAIAWRDGEVLVADASAVLTPDAGLHALDLRLRSRDLAPLRERYLSGWLGLFGLADLQLRGALEAQLRVADGDLQSASAELHDIDLIDGRDRFRFDGLAGPLRFSAGAPVAGALRWRGGQLYGLDFAAATLPLDSSDGELRLREAVTLPAFGGSLRFDDLVLRPPAGDAGLRLRFGLALDGLDIGALAQSLGWPAFQGELSGRIPNARYADERLQFDGGLTVQLFGGQVQVTQLSLERPFGVAPSLSADLALDDIDLMALTGVFDFGSIGGKLDGRIADLRLVDWTATAFDAQLHTDAAAARRAGVRQRISQRAVQNISSVGDSSFVSSLQGQLIGLFDDFGYRRIGIACRLANEVCEMGGLHSAGAGFTIVEGAGLPRLTVVGFNRQVDWPTLLERLAAAGKGDVKPVVQ